MTAQTESLHAGGFIISEGNGQVSRDTATVKSGENLKAGQVVQWDGTKLVAFDAVVDSVDALVAEAAGIMFDAVDATDGDVANAVIINFGAEVRLADLTYPAETTDGNEEALTIASLAKLFIKAR